MSTIEVGELLHEYTATFTGMTEYEGKWAKLN